MSAGRDYMDGSGSPLYSFGHGLSYTTFDYSDLTIIPTDNGDRWDVSFRLTNTGRRQGAEVAQLYLRDAVASTSQPPMLLKGFKRIELNPGESREVHFSLGPDELSVYNPALRRVVEPGLFRLMIGSSSTDIRLKGDFTVK